MKRLENCKKDWWKKYWKKGISITFSYRNHELSQLAHRVFTEVAPRNIFENSPIIDLKGRDKENLLLQTFSVNSKPSADEFLYFAANNPFIVAEELLTYRLNSLFKEFLGTHHITHQATESWAPSITLPSHFSEFIAPLEIKYFRFGIERFKSNFTSFLGYTPTVVERVILDCSEGEGKLLLYSEVLKNKEDLPFHQSGEAVRMLRVMNDVFSTT